MSDRVQTGFILSHDEVKPAGLTRLVQALSASGFKADVKPTTTRIYHRNAEKTGELELALHKEGVKIKLAE